VRKRGVPVVSSPDQRGRSARPSAHRAGWFPGAYAERREKGPRGDRGPRGRPGPPGPEGPAGPGVDELSGRVDEREASALEALGVAEGAGTAAEDAQISADEAQTTATEPFGLPRTPSRKPARRATSSTLLASWLLRAGLSRPASARRARTAAGTPPGDAGDARGAQSFGLAPRLDPRRAGGRPARGHRRRELAVLAPAARFARARAGRGPRPRCAGRGPRLGHGLEADSPAISACRREPGVRGLRPRLGCGGAALGELPVCSRRSCLVIVRLCGPTLGRSPAAARRLPSACVGARPTRSCCAGRSCRPCCG
jgi:hypothetical protein